MVSVYVKARFGWSDNREAEFIKSQAYADRALELDPTSAYAHLVLGFLGMKDASQKTLAIIGIALCVLGLLVGCGNAAYGRIRQLPMPDGPRSPPRTITAMLTADCAIR